MLEPGRSYNIGSNYRYGFNGLEQSNEIKGAGNSYTAEFWEYDPRIGKRWNLDPKPTIGISPYTAFSDNPVWFSDPLGDTVIGVTKSDAQNAVSDIQNILKGDKFAKVRDLIKVGKDKRTIDRVDPKALNESLKGQHLNNDDISLVIDIVGTLNSDAHHLITYAKNNDVLSEEQEKIFLKGFPEQSLKPIREANNGIPFWLLSGGYTGSGATVPTQNGTYSLLISGVPDNDKTDYFSSDLKTYVPPVGGRPATFGHEVLGHGRTLALGRINSQHVDAIQTENLILRVMGYKNIQRDGTNHGDFSQISKPSDIPTFINFAFLFWTLRY